VKGPANACVVVATCPSVAGVAPDEVQYGTKPFVSVVDVATFPVPEPPPDAVEFMVTAPVAPETVMFVPATMDVTPLGA
jgi:hypothetical protein